MMWLALPAGMDFATMPGLRHSRPSSAMMGTIVAASSPQQRGDTFNVKTSLDLRCGSGSIRGDSGVAWDAGAAGAGGVACEVARENQWLGESETDGCPSLPHMEGPESMDQANAPTPTTWGIDSASGTSDA